MNTKYNSLFESLTLANGLQLKNRLVMAPMTHFSSNPNGTVSDAEIGYYNHHAKDLGMVITACINVSENGKGFPGQFSGTSDDKIPGLKKLAAGIQEQGAAAILQIFHGGRSCPPDLVPNGDIVSSSAVPGVQLDGSQGPTPRELEALEIEQIIRDFGETTRRAIEAGFDGVEIHGANGYLIQQFFSPHSNQREDRFGGTLEKRMTFPLEIIKEVKRVVDAHAKTPFIIGYRFSPEEPTEPGITMADTLAFVDALSEQPLDYLHVSLIDYKSEPRRGVVTNKTRLELLADKINGRVPLIGVGSVQTAEDALNVLQTGSDLIALGREIIIDPDWVQKIKNEQEDQIETELDLNGQERLVIPDPLWKAIIGAPGWFPGVK
ncbi:NADH-dependent flavin oxidoreductase [Pullulanibacillus sp. KACC 23026]|uniref:NADH-dependent flavin oxidoreductase n=1 Tax=Pullulanibacillus sp. KACC 23026 TaxID=3028315 RepID=UPI0023B034A8|nr:NADH-dependent flavin oxidoreductase [Pullulanibacillus sp. KACC 23026]WEG11037.1 NADH-dependent flavin oxidoreductase [Pullulanibacillus sp. KACC 23026]